MDKSYVPKQFEPLPATAIPLGGSRSLHFSSAFFDRLLESRGQKPKVGIPRLTKFQYTVALSGFLLLLAASFIGAEASPSKLSAKSLGLTNLSSLGATVDQSTAISNSSSNPAPSTAPVSSSALAAYTVAPNLPRYLIIPSLSVDARVLSVGVTASGDIATPGDIYDTAWYNGSAQPGQPGAMLIDGHVSSWTADGVFYSLNRLVPGDTIEVERGDGTMFTYKVVKSQVYPSNNVNMAAALSPVTSGQPGLNLITCTGQLIAGTSQFNERLVVFATEVSS